MYKFRGAPVAIRWQNGLRADNGQCQVHDIKCGWVAEWFKAPVLKTGVGECSPWVRIPPHPPLSRDIVRYFKVIAISIINLPINIPIIVHQKCGVRARLSPLDPTT